MARPTKLQAANYEAETRLVKRVRFASPLGRRYLSERDISLDEACRYIAAVQAEAWFKTAWPNEAAPVMVVASERSASYSLRAARTLWSHPDHRKNRAEAELVLLHELAHILTRPISRAATRRRRMFRERMQEDEMTKGHTKAWRDNYARLVGGAFGPRWARRLREELDREPSICTCDGRHMSPACREFGAHPW